MYVLREGTSVCSNFSGVGQIIIDYKQKQPSCVEKNAYVCKQVKIFMERFGKMREKKYVIYKTKN